MDITQSPLKLQFMLDYVKDVVTFLRTGDQQINDTELILSLARGSNVTQKPN